MILNESGNAAERLARRTAERDAVYCLSAHAAEQDRVALRAGEIMLADAFDVGSQVDDRGEVAAGRVRWLAASYLGFLHADSRHAEIQPATSV